MVGGAVAAGIAAAHGLPLIPVHHMEGHLLAPMLEQNRPQFPFVALLVSGGHTLLVAVRGVGRYEILGESLDDAVGEAFDKTAKMMGLPYPGGPHLAELAQQGRPGRYKFPRPMTDRPGLDFSFSGLKTAVLTALKPGGGPERGIHAASPHLGILPGASEQAKADIAQGFQEAVTETLAIKCARALEQTGFAALVVAGGVGANLRLRERLDALARERGISVYFPRHEFCTDNAAMIAYVGWARRKLGQSAPASLALRARWPLTELEAA